MDNVHFDDLLRHGHHDVHRFKNDHYTNDTDDILHRDNYRPGEHHYNGNPNQHCAHNGDLLNYFEQHLDYLHHPDSDEH